MSTGRHPAKLNDRDLNLAQELREKVVVQGLGGSPSRRIGKSSISSIGPATNTISYVTLCLIGNLCVALAREYGRVQITPEICRRGRNHNARKQAGTQFESNNNITQTPPAVRTICPHLLQAAPTFYDFDTVVDENCEHSKRKYEELLKVNASIDDSCESIMPASW